MFCGFNLTAEKIGEKTTMEASEPTLCESLEDFSDGTKVLSTESFSKKPQKIVKTQNPLFFAWLVSAGGTDKGKDYRIIKEKTTIGKSETSDIVIKSDFISRNHAILFHEKDKFILNDLESTNHTFVNDKKISRRILKDNDLIKFGEAVFKFKCL
jgi:pSer/pThr/pTyr-binding forkhead associated (FHA) protein